MMRCCRAGTRLAQRFEHHQSQIEQTGRALLEIYREANRGTRSTPAPDYFTKPYAMARISYTGGEPNRPRATPCAR